MLHRGQRSTTLTTSARSTPRASVRPQLPQTNSTPLCAPMKKTKSGSSLALTITERVPYAGSGMIRNLIRRVPPESVTGRAFFLLDIATNPKGTQGDPGSGNITYYETTAHSGSRHRQFSGHHTVPVTSCSTFQVCRPLASRQYRYLGSCPQGLEPWQHRARIARSTPGQAAG